MDVYKFPCPRCCKNIDVPTDMIENGGIATCKSCSYRLNVTGRKNRMIVKIGQKQRTDRKIGSRR